MREIKLSKAKKCIQKISFIRGNYKICSMIVWQRMACYERNRFARFWNKQAMLLVKFCFWIFKNIILFFFITTNGNLEFNNTEYASSEVYFTKTHPGFVLWKLRRGTLGFRHQRALKLISSYIFIAIILCQGLSDQMRIEHVFKKAVSVVTAIKIYLEKKLKAGRL